MAVAIPLLLCFFCAVPSAFALAGLLRAEQLQVGEGSRSHAINTSIDSSPVTTFRCVGDSGNRSCIFRNLYFTRGEFVMYVTDRPRNSDIRLYRADKYEGPWHPDVQEFPSTNALADHLASKDVIEERGLSVQFNPLFHQNIGHALFDGLYPAYLSTVKLGVQDKPWRPVVSVDAGCFDESGVGGPLQKGELVETYVPHPKYQRSLRPIRATIISVPTAQLVEPQCDWKIGLDHGGLDLGATPGNNQADCMNGCAQTFSCKAVVLFAGICYFKGEGGTRFSSPGRELCVLQEAPTSKLVEPQCDWKIGLDHNGLDLGGTPGYNHAACMKGCAQTFACKAVVLFAGICYFKGEGGTGYSNPGRELCILPEAPKPNIVVMPEQGQGVELKHMNISQEWVVARGGRRRCMSEGVYENFGGVNEIRRLFDLERDARNHPNLVVRFEEIVMGVGGAGNLIADRTGAIGGSVAPQDTMRHFRDRMLRSYGLDVQSSVKPRPIDSVLNVMVVENKRFRPEDSSALADVIRRLNEQGNIHAEFVNWRKIGDSDHKFREHLRKTQQADVYISSIGTALQYVPFLRDGSVYVALGSVWKKSGRYFPTFMEQQLAGGGTPYLRTLYADPGAVLRQPKPSLTLPEDGYYVGVNGTLVWDLMQKAEKLIRQGFRIPVAVEDNLSPEAKVLVELCRRNEFACNEMHGYRNFREYDCEVPNWNEIVVYEIGPWGEGGKCGHSHHALLRQLRKEFGLPNYGAPPAN